MSESDSELLARFAGERCEQAFTTLVRRHLGLVRAAALRRVRSPQAAEDIAQSVFLDLAQRAHRLPPGTVLAAWLYQVTQRTAVDVIRRESRRQHREQAALEMNALESAPDDWTRIAPLLDDALQALDVPDREAILLRYFQNQPLREVGTALGISEDAAQKRVRRAMDRLRERLAGRNVSVVSGGLAALLSSHAAPTASDALVSQIANSVLRGLPGLPMRQGLVAGVLSGFRSLVGTSIIPQLAVGALVVAIGGGLIWITVGGKAGRDADGSAPTVPAAITTPVTDVPAPAVSEPAAAATPPDPRELLRGVARARQQFASGMAEYSITVTLTGQGTTRDETNQAHTTLFFDGNKRRAEQTNREYSYAYSENEAEQEAIKKRADAMDRESAVREGLLKPFPSRHILVTDGQVLMDFWDTGNGRPKVTLDEPRKGSTAHLFDPRCLGLGTYVGPSTTMDHFLGLANSKSVELLGLELVEGVTMWHVRVELPAPSPPVELDFWMDAARPERLLRHSFNGEWVTSRYDDSDPGNPIPSEVYALKDRPGGPRIAKRYVRLRSDWAASVDPAQFTLAGLGIPVGTEVSDHRKMRSMGYWTGTGLSDDLPEAKALETPTAPVLAELMALLEFSPASDEARDAAIWIVLNNPDGPEVDRAFEVLRAHHPRAPGLLPLCREQARVRHRGSQVFLEALLRENHDTTVRGTACFVLGIVLKDEAKFGQNTKAAAAAMRHLERAINEFGAVEWQGNPLAKLAAPELDELRRLSLGQPAPEIAGQDLDGQPMRLSEHRGRVVVLMFWWNEFSEANEIRKLSELFADQEFSVLGVFGEDDLEAGRSEAGRRGMSWRSFWDHRDGPIAKEWNVRGWPNLWVLDRQGIIRHRGLRGPELRQAVERLLKE